MKRILPFILIFILLLCSCGRKTPGYDAFYQYDETDETVYDNGLSSASVVMTAGKSEVTYAELRYSFLTAKSRLADGEWERFDDAQKESFIKNTVLPDLFFSRCAATLAQEYNIALSEEEYAEYNGYIENAVDRYAGKDKFIAFLKEENMTYDLYAFSSLQGMLTTKVCDYYTNELTTPTHADDKTVISASENGEIIHVKHILIKNDIGEDKSENKALAEEIAKRAKAGEDFDSLVSEYSEDPELVNEPDGYYIVKYEMDDAFSDVAFSLDVGEISDVVYVNSSYSGYHIILRCEVDEGYIDKNLDTLRVNYLASKFYEEVYKMCADLDITYTEEYDKIDFDKE